MALVSDAQELRAAQTGHLYNACCLGLPELRRTAQESATWVDKQGRLVHPRQGMADIGNDMARLQRNPAYARQAHARMRRMSPQELMALSQRMTQPMNQDPQRVNEAQAMAVEAPAVRAAAEAGEAYADAAGSRVHQLSGSSVNQHRLVGYDATAVGEVLHLTDRIGDTVVVNSGVQAILAPARSATEAAASAACFLSAAFHSVSAKPSTTAAGVVTEPSRRAP